MNKDENNKTFGLFESVFNRKLISELEEEQSKVYKFPQIETKKVKLIKESLTYLNNLLYFDCIIFTDILTARYFLQCLEENEIDLFILDEVRILTYGETVSDELRLLQIHADVIPGKLDGLSIQNSLKNYFGTQYFENLKILILHKKNSEPEILHLLNVDKLEICKIAVYEIVEKIDDLTKLKIILQSGGIDEFLITSPLDLIWFKEYFEDFSFDEVKIRAKGEIISRLLSENNIKHNIWNK